MSALSERPQSEAPPTQEPDAVAGRTVSLAALVVAVLATAFALSAWLIIRSTLHGTAPPGYVASRGGAPPLGVNNIEMYLFREPPPSLRSKALRRLGSYGWADPNHRALHIPIRRAMSLYLAGLRAGQPARSPADPNARARAEESR